MAVLIISTIIGQKWQEKIGEFFSTCHLWPFFLPCVVLTMAKYSKQSFKISRRPAELDIILDTNII